MFDLACVHLCFEKRFEMPLHIVSIAWPFCDSALTGAGLEGIYNEAAVGAYIKEYPRGCVVATTTTNTCYSALLTWIFSGGFVLIVIVRILPVFKTP